MCPVPDPHPALHQGRLACNANPIGYPLLLDLQTA